MNILVNSTIIVLCLLICVLGVMLLLDLLHPEKYKYYLYDSLEYNRDTKVVKVTLNILYKHKLLNMMLKSKEYLEIPLDEL